MPAPLTSKLVILNSFYKLWFVGFDGGSDCPPGKSLRQVFWMNASSLLCARSMDNYHQFHIKCTKLSGNTELEQRRFSESMLLSLLLQEAPSNPPVKFTPYSTGSYLKDLSGKGGKGGMTTGSSFIFFCRNRMAASSWASFPW